MFIKYGDSNSVAILLAKAGYDVWIGNNRGNKYTYKEGDREDYSFIELGKYDLPVLLDIVIKNSGQS